MPRTAKEEPKGLISFEVYFSETYEKKPSKYFHMWVSHTGCYVQEVDARAVPRGAVIHSGERNACAVLETELASLILRFRGPRSRIRSIKE